MFCWGRHLQVSISIGFPSNPMTWGSHFRVVLPRSPAVARWVIQGSPPPYPIGFCSSVFNPLEENNKDTCIPSFLLNHHLGKKKAFDGKMPTIKSRGEIKMENVQCFMSDHLGSKRWVREPGKTATQDICKNCSWMRKGQHVTAGKSPSHQS